MRPADGRFCDSAAALRLALAAAANRDGSESWAIALCNYLNYAIDVSTVIK